MTILSFCRKLFGSRSRPGRICGCRIHTRTSPYPTNYCPHCKSKDLILGPSAGAGRDLLCRNCTHEYVVLEVGDKFVFMQELGPATMQRWTQVYRQPQPSVIHNAP
jgi:hypothetical protein